MTTRYGYASNKDALIKRVNRGLSRRYRGRRYRCRTQHLINKSRRSRICGNHHAGSARHLV
jgi:hypothetical protein